MMDSVTKLSVAVVVGAVLVSSAMIASPVFLYQTKVNMCVESAKSSWRNNHDGLVAYCVASME